MEVYHCCRVACPLADALLPAQAWVSIPSVTLVLAETGAPASKSTAVRMCWDDTALHIRFDCQDTRIWGTLVDRDDPVYTEDVVEAFICPGSDLATYFEINVSPRNTVFDAVIARSEGSQGRLVAQPEWNCRDLQTVVSVDGVINDPAVVDKGWSAELCIPFASIDSERPVAGQTWRLNLFRIDRDPEPIEHQAWRPTLVEPANFHVPERFGSLVFTDKQC